MKTSNTSEATYWIVSLVSRGTLMFLDRKTINEPHYQQNDVVVTSNPGSALKFESDEKAIGFIKLMSSWNSLWKLGVSEIYVQKVKTTMTVTDTKRIV